MFRRFTPCPWLTCILAGALILRLGSAIAVQVWVNREPGRLCLIAGDAEGYWQLAQHMVRGEDFALYDPPRHVMRMPGFPVFLAGLMTVFGKRALLIRVGLAGVGTAACGLVYCLGREVADPETGRVAALIAAVSPIFAAFSVLLLSETLFALLLLASLIAFAKLLGAQVARRSLRMAILTGLFCGLATLVRPTWFLVAPALAVCSVFRAASPGRKFIEAGLICLAFAATLAPWTIRNAHVIGHFVPTTLWVGPSLYDGLSPQATGASDMTFIETDGIYHDRHISEYDADRHYRRAALEFARAHPARAVELGAVKLRRFWNPFPNADQFASWPIRWGVGLYELPLLLVAALGCWRARRQPLHLLLMAGPVAYFSLVHSVFVGSLRYRLPAEYALVVLTAIGCRFLLKARPRSPLAVTP